MSDHSDETRLALVEQAVNALKEAVDRMASKMVTHADLAALATRSQLDALERRVQELEQVSPTKLWSIVTKIAAGLVVAAAAWKLLRG
jgi:hypothetical protein